MLKCIVLLSVLTVSACAATAPTGLMCEMLDNPAVTTIADASPEFSWVVQSELSNDIQTAGEADARAGGSVEQRQGAFRRFGSGSLWRYGSGDRQKLFLEGSHLE